MATLSYTKHRILRKHPRLHCGLRCIFGLMLITAIPVLISGCSVVPQQDSNVTPDFGPDELTAHKDAEDIEPEITYQPFETETLYALLVAEIAGSRNRLDVMLNNYEQQAVRTRDPGVTARASRLARYMNAQKASLDMALLWVELEPDNLEAHFNATAALVYANRFVDAFEHAAILLAAGETSGLDAIGAKAATGDINTTHELVKRFAPLSQEYPEDTALLLGYSYLLQHTGDLDGALKASRQALQYKTDHLQAALQEIRLLQQQGHNKEATQRLAQLVDDNPENIRLRLQYARTLTQSDLEEAQAQFIVLLQQSPDDPDLTLALALIYYERGLLQEAESTLEPLLGSPRHQSSAHYYTARIAKSQTNIEKAIEHFQHVEEGTDFLSAQAQLTQLLVDTGKAEKAIEQLKNTRKDASPKYQEPLQMIEANALITSSQHTKAEQSLNSILELSPESLPALYTRAMLYVSMDKFEEAEKDLKFILSINPDHAAALNALGYTLADRTNRLQEALGYVTRALELTPNDPAVLDSMGWIQYRLGNYDAALEKLRKAMSAMPDHEIAAHLGEVLWVMGIKNEAREVWSKGLQLRPQSAIIIRTLERLNASLTP